MRSPGITDRERLQTLASLACVALLLGLLSGAVAAGAWTALGLLAFALFLPAASAWLVAGWKTVTHRVASVVTGILLCGVYVAVVTPIGWIRRLGRPAAAKGSGFVDAAEGPDGPAPESWDRPG